MIIVDNEKELHKADEGQVRLLRRPAPQTWVLLAPGRRPLFVPRGYDGVPEHTKVSNKPKATKKAPRKSRTRSKK